MIEYTLTRSKRKTIAIYIKENGEVEVRAPKRASTIEINHFVLSKQEWIDKHVLQNKNRAKNKSEFTLNYGTKILFRGDEYNITAQKTDDNFIIGFSDKCFYLPPDLSHAGIQAGVKTAYMQAAKTLLIEKTAHFSKIMGVQPSSVKIGEARTYWGSCNGKNGINYSFYLIMAGDDVIDYVVVHELAHIIEHNHSERFWTRVSAIIPDYKQKKYKLKLLQNKISNENWE